jgi:hypothetical protein
MLAGVPQLALHPINAGAKSWEQAPWQQNPSIFPS